MIPRVIQRFIFYAEEVWILVRDTYYHWSEDRASILGAALAFYTIFSLAPILIIIVAVVGFILGKVSVHSYITGELIKFLGEADAKYIMSTVIDSYQSSSGIKATIVAISLMIIGATTMCMMLRDALNTIWGAESSPLGIWDFLKTRIMSLLMVLLAGGFLFLSMVISTVLYAGSFYLSNFINIPLNLLTILNYIISFVLLSLLFALSFKLLPDMKICWGDVWVGSVMTAILFILGRYLLGLYLARSSVSSAYGAAGSLVVILLWVYYCAQIIFLGAEFTKVYAKRYGSDIVPKARKPQQKAVG